MNKKQIFTLITLILLCTGNFYVSGIWSMINLLLTLFLYSIFTYILYWMYKKLKKSDYRFFLLENYYNFLHFFLYRVNIFIVLLLSIIGGFAYYQNEISLAKMPTYSLSNGEKRVIFQGMSHIGTQDFYDQVQTLIKTHKEKGSVLYFEGVRPGSEENHEIFNKALGVKFDEHTYENMSQLYGLVKQDNHMFLGLVNDQDFNVDISIDEIITKYEDIKDATGVSNRNYENPLDASELIVKELSKLNERELKILRYINKAFVNMIIKSEGLQKAIQDNFTNKELFEVILNERNKVIAEEIISSEHREIITIYGVLHFQGVFELLKQNDIKWRITEINYLYPLK